MKHFLLAAAFASALILIPAATEGKQVPLGNRPILEVAQTLKPGEFVWAPERSASGPALVVVNLATQRLLLFRNGVPIAASTVSSGAPGHETPTGVFTILQKRKEHYSSTYNNAPMPNMQRLTKRGIALHAGNLPGYPASHGCVRLPHTFSRLLFGATELGMTVVITSISAAPQHSAAPALVASSAAQEGSLGNAPYEWHPQRATEGVVSVVISIADQRAIVMRDGVEIGSAPVRVDGGEGAMAYVLRAWDEQGMHWLKLRFAGDSGGMEVIEGEGRKFQAPIAFRRAVATLLRPGSVIVVTPESLGTGSPGKDLTVLEAEPVS